MLTLDPAAALAEGKERLIFADPRDPTRLIKVLKPQPDARFTRWTFGDLTQRYIPSTRYRTTAKQYDEYLRLMLRHRDDPDFVPPITHLFGFATTSLGLGSVTERVTDPDGLSGPTLEDLDRSGTLDDNRLAQLNALIARLHTLGVRAGDLNPGNFVYGARHLGDRPSPPDWVLVDGFGDLHAVPVRSLGDGPARLGLDDCFKRARKRVSLRWNASKRRYERA